MATVDVLNHIKNITILWVVALGVNNGLFAPQFMRFNWEGSNRFVRGGWVEGDSWLFFWCDNVGGFTWLNIECYLLK